MTRRRRNALDQLEYEDVALLRLLRAMHDEHKDPRQHGRILKILVERMAVRQAAREAIARSLASFPELSAVATRLDERLAQHRSALDDLDDLTRGLAPTNVNQGQDVDRAVERIEPDLLTEIDEELTEVIPAVRRALDSSQRRGGLPSAHYVLRHCPLHPGAHDERRWYERVPGLVWVHAVYDYLRSLPIGGVRPRATITIPGEGELRLEEASRRA